MTNKKYTKLTRRELEVMQVLWKANKALTATEIFDLLADGGLSIFSIQNTLKSLFSKKMIEVSSYTKVYKTNAREYKPSLNADDYAVMQFTHYFSSNGTPNLPNLVATLLKYEDEKSEESIIRELEKLIQTRKAELKKKGGN